jgi:uncharacterized alpha-E superfamily protein
MLLSRVADRIYWAARYIERSEDTARLVRAHGELMADLPAHVTTQWEPLVTVVGSDAQFERTLDVDQVRVGARAHSQPQTAQSGSQSQSQSQSQSGGGSQSQSQSQTMRPTDVSEMAVTSFLVSDRTNPNSVASCVVSARENLRTTRDTMPRDGWRTLNDLYLYVSTEADRGRDRRVRERFLNRVIADSRRLDGVLATAMTHDEAYIMWRLGRALERADMTTRVLGVRAAAVLSAPNGSANGDSGALQGHDEVQWMGVLRSVQGLQMYQRAVRGPIEGPSVVRFLLEHDRFPRAVRALLREIRRALAELPDPGTPLDAVDHVEAVLRESTAASTDGAALDDAMDSLQVAIATLDKRITDRYLQVG